MKIHFHEKPWRLDCLLIVGLFVGACALAAGPTSRALSLTFFGDETAGTITHVEWRRVSHRRSAPFHHFTYKTATGELRKGTPRYPSLFISGQVGDPITIRHRGDDADIASLNHLWGVPALALIAAGALLFMIIQWCRRNINFAHGF